MKSPMGIMVLAAATLSIANPVSLRDKNSVAAVLARANPTGVKCPLNTWTSTEVVTAFDGLKNNANLPNKGKPRFGSKYYPHAVNPDKDPNDTAVKDALDKIPECKTGQTDKTYLIFPIASTIYKGGDPGPDRVIAMVSGAKPFSDYTYCLAVGHPTKTDNNFVACPES